MKDKSAELSNTQMSLIAMELVKLEELNEELKETLDTQIKSLQIPTPSEIKSIITDTVKIIVKDITDTTDVKIKSIKTLCPKDVEAIVAKQIDIAVKSLAEDTDVKLKSIELSVGERGEAGTDGAGVDSPLWEEGVYRKDVIVTHNMGQYFKALKDTSTEPGTSDEWQRLGLGGLRFTDTYKKDFDYQVGDLFIKDYSLFMKSDKGTHLVAKSGRPGKTGSVGKQGAKGLTGGVPDLDYSKLLPMIEDVVYKFLNKEV